MYVMQAYEEPLRNFGHRSQQGLLSTQRFFYSKSLDDRQCFRIEDFCLPCDEQYKIAPIQKQVLKTLLPCREREPYVCYIWKRWSLVDGLGAVYCSLS